MRRQKRNGISAIAFKGHLDLIRHAAWSFHRSTGIQWQELFSEACLAYCECLQSYDPSKGAPTTWVYTAMKNTLINFCKREGRNKSIEGIEHWYETSFTPFYEFLEDYTSLSDDTVEILKMVRANPSRYADRKTLHIIKTDLRELKQWSYTRIWKAMQALREELAANRPVRTVWRLYLKQA